MKISFPMHCNNSSVRWAFNVGAWVPTNVQWLLASSCIQEEEKKRIGRFVYRKDAKSSLIGRLLLRKYVCDHSERHYSSIQFGRDERGKPYLIDDQLNCSAESSVLNFNVSHQGNYAVLAGESGNRRVGIDIMKLEYTGGKSLSDFFRLMTRHFSPEEWVSIRGFYGMPDEQKLTMFCRHWCLKESYVKATGTGITVDLQRISFKIMTQELKKESITSDTELYVDGNRLADWRFEETLLDDQHCVAVALSPSSVTSHVDRNGFRLLMFDELVENCESLLPPDPIYCHNFFKKDERPL